MLVGMLMVSIGMHWALLQSIAWASMLARYSQQGYSVSTALAQTFDGKHPCKICRVTESGRKAQSSAEKIVPIQKQDLFSQRIEVSWSPVFVAVVPKLPAPAAWTSVQFKPPFPPPRSV
jgi:hypothetical protein